MGFPGLLCPWDSPGKNIGVGCHFPLQGIFPTQGSKSCLMSPALAGGFFTSLPLAPYGAIYMWDFLVAQTVSSLPATWGT